MGADQEPCQLPPTVPSYDDFTPMLSAAKIPRERIPVRPRVQSHLRTAMTNQLNVHLNPDAGETQKASSDVDDIYEEPLCENSTVSSIGTRDGIVGNCVDFW